MFVRHNPQPSPRSAHRSPGGWRSGSRSGWSSLRPGRRRSGGQGADGFLAQAKLTWENVRCGIAFRRMTSANVVRTGIFITPQAVMTPR